MAENIVNVGIDLSKDPTSRQGLKPIKDEKGSYRFGGLVPARVLDISLDDTTFEKGEFKDLVLKTLHFEFGNYPLTEDEPDRFLTVLKRMPGTQQKVNPNAEDSAYKNMDADTIQKIAQGTLSFIQHIIMNLTTSPFFKPLKDIPVAKAKLFSNIPVLPEVDVKDRVKHWNKLFETLVEWVNGENKMYHTKDGQGLPAWLKLTPNVDTNPKFNRTWYTLSPYVGKGLIEPMKFRKDGTIIPPQILEIKDLATLALGSRSSFGADSDIMTGAIPNNISVDALMNG